MTRDKSLAAAAVVTAMVWCLAPADARAQVPPFFDGAPGLFDPEVRVVNSGVVSDVGAVVSADRKYVTLNMRPSQSNLLALREFKFQGGGGGNADLPQGFAGDPAPAPAIDPAEPATNPPAAAGQPRGERPPDQRPRDQQPPNERPRGERPPVRSILRREGMTLLSKPAAAPVETDRPTSPGRE